MLRLLRTFVLITIGTVLVTVGVANRAPVDLYLLPVGLGGEGLVLRGVWLSAVILASIFVGVVIGEVFEWARESKHRRSAKHNARECEILREENARLKSKLGTEDDLPKIAA